MKKDLAKDTGTDRREKRYSRRLFLSALVGAPALTAGFHTQYDALRAGGGFIARFSPNGA